MSAEHEIRMGCWCPEKYRVRRADKTSKCSWCGREWTPKMDEDREERSKALKELHGED